MRTTIIPYAAVVADYAQVKQKQDTSHPTSRSQRFNTAHHTRLDMLPAIRESATFTHSPPPWTPYGYVLWQPLVARSQKLVDARVVRIPGFLLEDLMRCHAASVSTNAIPAGLIQEVVAMWRSTGKGRKLEGILDGEKEWFIRLDQMSPKDSPFGGKEATRSFDDVVRKMCSSMRAWNALQNEVFDAKAQERELRINLILNPWDASMTAANEFRCFVPPPAARGAAPHVDNLRLSAVSHYAWHHAFTHPFQFSAHKTADAVVSGATFLLQEIQSFLSNMPLEIKMLLLRHGFTFDLALQPDATVHLVEINPFGALSGCGACLFHWVRDARVLYGFFEDVEFRITAGRMCAQYCCWGCEVVCGCESGG
ncbi:hypothetical protein N0V86_005939 [Didymella sp. IMI 355093]|nr:hypothetical protein N0V86_005939 [Didymella sp. IMI 355093]